MVRTAYLLHTYLANKVYSHTWAMRSTHLLLAVTAVWGPVRQHLEAQPGHEGEGSLLAAGGEVTADEGLHAVGDALVGDAVVQLQTVGHHGRLVAAAAQLTLLVCRLLVVNFCHLLLERLRLLLLVPA